MIKIWFEGLHLTVSITENSMRCYFVVIFSLCCMFFARFVDVDSGRVVGEHSGMEVLTVGQKARIKNKTDKYYVVSKASDIAPAIERMSCSQPEFRDVMAFAVRSHSPQLLEREPYKYRAGDVFVCYGVAHPARFALRASVSAAVFSWVSGKLPVEVVRQIKQYCTQTLHQHQHHVLHIDLDGNNRVISSTSVVDRSHDSVAMETLMKCECQCRYRKGPIVCFVEARPIARLSSAECMEILEQIHQYTDEDFFSSVVHFDDNIGQNIDPSSELVNTSIATTTPPTTTAADSSVAVIKPLVDLLRSWNLVVHFQVPEMDVCPGQILALYSGDVCLGGGEISTTSINWPTRAKTADDTIV